MSTQIFGSFVSSVTMAPCIYENWANWEIWFLFNLRTTDPLWASKSALHSVIDQ